MKEFRKKFRAFSYIASIGVPLILITWYSSSSIPVMIPIILGALGFFIIPTLFIHIEYVVLNNEQAVDLNYNEVVLHKRGAIKKYSITEIDRLVIYHSPSFVRSGALFFPTEYYYYVKIILKDGSDPLFITCFYLSDSLEELNKLTNVKREIKATLFPSINYPLVF